MAYPEVIRVFATSQDPDFDGPWQARTPSNSTGSAVVIGKGLLLTGAHVVANATFLQVQKPSQPDKAIARVRAVSHDCDLALLEVIEPAGLPRRHRARRARPDAPPARRGRRRRLSGRRRGDLDHRGRRVAHRGPALQPLQRHLLAVTVDAAINAGNSGGPVFGDGKVVGIAFQKLTGVDNIGEMVPPPIIRAFLDGVDGRQAPRDPGARHHDAEPREPAAAPAARPQPTERGVVVLHVDYGGSADGMLQPRDVITAIDGLPIANNGTVQYIGHYRTRYDVVLGHRYIGDKHRARDQARRHRAHRRARAEAVDAARAALALRPAAAYFVYGGLVFQTLTRDYLTTWDKWWNKAPKEFLNYYYLGFRSAEQHEVVILTQILADEINVGYGHLYNEAVAKLDGKGRATWRTSSRGCRRRAASSRSRRPRAA